MATLLENANRIKNDKEAIRQAIADKGISVGTGISLDKYAEQIAKISASDGKILAGVGLKASIRGSATETWSSTALRNAKPKNTELYMGVTLPTAIQLSITNNKYDSFFIAVNFRFPTINESYPLRMNRVQAVENVSIAGFYYFDAIQIFASTQVSPKQAYFGGAFGGVTWDTGNKTSTVPASTFGWNLVVPLMTSPTGTITNIEFKRVCTAHTSTASSDCADFFSVMADPGNVYADFVIAYK